MVFAMAARDAADLTTETAALEKRFAAAGIETRYYTPAVHQGAFAMPPYIRTLLDS